MIRDLLGFRDYRHRSVHFFQFVWPSAAEGHEEKRPSCSTVVMSLPRWARSDGSLFRP